MVICEKSRVENGIKGNLRSYLQPVAQRGTTAERAGALCALNPVAAAVLGVLFLGETLTYKGIIGGILIIASILLP